MAVLAVLSFGAVDPWIRGGVGVLAATIAAYLLARPRRRSAPPSALVIVWFVAFGVAVWGFSAFLPVGPGLRSVLQPGCSDVLGRVGTLAGWEVRPLALHPRGALFATAYSVHMLLVAAAAAVVVSSAYRAGRISSVLVATALGMLTLHLAQWLGGATSVGWVSGIGEGRAFFGTFVNPNHGGVLCAVVSPLAMALALERRRFRPFFFVAATALAAGTVLSGSRGATAALGLGFVVFALLDGRRLLVGCALATCGVTGGALALLGPDALFALFSGVVDPSIPRGADLLSSRPQMWRDASEVLTLAPSVGVGGDGFLDAYKYIKTSPRFALASQAHSDPFQIAVEHGWLSLCLWSSAAVFVFGSGIRACLRGERSVRTTLAGYVAALATLFAFALFDFPMRIGALLLIGALAVGVTLGISYRNHAPAPRWARVMASATAVLIGLAGVGCLVLATTARKSAFGDFDVSLEAGAAALEADDFEGAERHFSTALAQRPMNQMALLQLARAFHKQEQHTRTIEVLELAGEVYPTYPFTWLNLARRHRAAGNREAALDSYRRLIALNHPSEEPKPWLDEAFSYAGDFENLVGYLLRDRADRWCPAAQWLEQSGDRKDAELLYRLGAERSDQCSAELGWRFVSWGRPEEALAWLAPLPSTCLSERTRGYALLNLGRDQQGLEAFEVALERCGGRDRRARLGLARARLAVGDQRAVAMLERLLDDRDEPTVRRLLFRAYRDGGRPRKAAEQVISLSKGGFARVEEVEWLAAYGTGGMK